MSRIKVGLIGCGRVARRIHLNVLRALPEARVVAVAEPNARRRQEAGQVIPQAQLFSDYRALLSESDAEAVLICLPSSLHAEAALTAFKASTHVYVEKPGAISRAEAEAVIEAWRRSGRVATMGLNFRFHPLYVALRDEMRKGRVGEPVAVRSVFCAAARALPAWKQACRSGGGVLLDLAVHHIDLARFIFDREVEEVTAHLRSVRSEADTAALDLRLSGDVLVQSLFSMSAVERDCFEVYGTAGRLAVDRYGSGRLTVTPTRRPRSMAERVGASVSALADAPRRILNAIRPPADPSHRASVQAFLNAVRQNDPTAVRGLDDAFRTLAVVFAAEEAAHSGRSISLADSVEVADWGTTGSIK